MHTLRFNAFSKNGVQSRVGAIPRLPFKSNNPKVHGLMDIKMDLH
jgi:hypothetical protein